MESKLFFNEPSKISIRLFKQMVQSLWC